MTFQGVERLARPLSTGLDHNGGVPVVGEDVVDFNTEGPTGQFEDPAKQFLDLLVALEVPREWVAPGRVSDYVVIKDRLDSAEVPLGECFVGSA